MRIRRYRDSSCNSFERCATAGAARSGSSWRGVIAATALVFLGSCGGGSDGRVTVAPTAPAYPLTARLQPRVLAAAAPTPLDAANQLMDYGESAYPTLFPGHPATASFTPFAYRYYPQTGMYLGVVVSDAPGYRFGGVYVMGGRFGTAPTYAGLVTDFIAPVAPGPAFTDAISGASLPSGASAFNLTRVHISGLELTDATVVFSSAGNPQAVLVPNVDAPGEFWLPVTLSRTSGTVSVVKSGATIASTQLTLVPFETSGVPGEAAMNFLQASSFAMAQSIAERTAARQAPEVVEALTAAREATQDVLAHVLETMATGSSTIAHDAVGQPVIMSPSYLKVLDQMVMYTAHLAARGGTLPPLPPQQGALARAIGHLIPSAYAQSSSCIPQRSLAGLSEPARQSVANDIAWCQANAQAADEQAFANNMRAWGEGLKYTSYAVLATATLGGSFVVQGVLVNASEILAATGTFATRYGVAVSFISNLKDHNVADAFKTLLIEASDELLKYTLKEYATLVIDKLNLKDLLADTLKKFSTVMAKKYIKDKLKALVEGYKASLAGTSVCSDGTIPVTNPNDGIGHCP